MKIQEFKNKLSQTIQVFKQSLSEVRTGGASTSLVENIKVEAYPGSQLTIKELATINVVDATLLTVVPWDTSVVSKIENSIREAGIGLNPVVDHSTIKVPVPQLNEEQRKNFVKMAKDKLEDSKIAVRNLRQDAMKSIDEQEENSVMSEDEADRERKTIEDEVKSANVTLEDLFKSKEKEILTI